ncbi:hypothetical protein ONZ45_g9254 [Pleurotus djamor]|nr:hypothetical protein ONZ45_g9254 [Pleurotus djamor]
MISLEALEDPDGLDRDFVAAGRVAAYMAEDDDDEEEDEDFASEGTGNRHEDSRNLPFVHPSTVKIPMTGSHFGEQLIVVGPQLPSPQSKFTSHKHRLHKFVSTALAFKTAANPFAKAIKPVRRIGDRASPYYEQVVVGDITFFVGDVTVVIPDLNKASSCIINVQKLPGSLEDIIPDADLHTYFWFACPSVFRAITA